MYNGVEVQEAPIETIPGLARIPMAFTVERVIDRPYVKDYDQLTVAGPADWATCDDIRRWGCWVKAL